MSAASVQNFDSQILDDRELVHRLLADDELAWRWFHAHYARLICQCITRVTVRFAASPDDVEEVHASLYLELWKNDKRKLRTFDCERGTKLSTWLALLATHAAYDFLRRRKRARLLLEAEAREVEAGRAFDPDACFSEKEEAALIAEAVRELSPTDQEFFELYFWRGLSAKEVAERLCISIGTVYSKKHKLQGRLLGLMGKRDLAA